jgi:hypothetical protein
MVVAGDEVLIVSTYIAQLTRIVTFYFIFRSPESADTKALPLVFALLNNLSQLFIIYLPSQQLQGKLQTQHNIGKE